MYQTRQLFCCETNVNMSKCIIPKTLKSIVLLFCISRTDNPTLHSYAHVCNCETMIDIHIIHLASTGIAVASQPHSK